jgi:hypothetical protein
MREGGVSIFAAVSRKKCTTQLTYRMINTSPSAGTARHGTMPATNATATTVIENIMRILNRANSQLFHCRIKDFEMFFEFSFFSFQIDYSRPSSGLQVTFRQAQ